MPDDLSRKTPEDPTRINVHQAWEVSYWTRTLGVSADQLRNAVARVGNSTAAVRRHLGV